jgi:hypothetical protein
MIATAAIAIVLFFGSKILLKIASIVRVAHALLKKLILEQERQILCYIRL